MKDGAIIIISIKYIYWGLLIVLWYFKHCTINALNILELMKSNCRLWTYSIYCRQMWRQSKLSLWTCTGLYGAFEEHNCPNGAKCYIYLSCQRYFEHTVQGKQPLVYNFVLLNNKIQLKLYRHNSIRKIIEYL